ncbi:DEKNAAC101281 [Brettanomyces naardenensis]|uniref:DEKNAAC101281 n=1 Tax=Brettanomyces naardenensis TaxID=13370 RepID=A0A448YHX3_BRENA|nr:DEKNAAC101281 [Brettanomyces naardenensis]
MLISLILAVLGFIWLAHRLSSLLSVRLDRAVRALNISVPNVPLISVDKVIYNSIVLHWDCAGNDSESKETKESNPIKESTSSTVPTGAAVGASSASSLPTPTSFDGPPLLSQASPASLSHFLLYINGLQAATVSGEKQSCTLEGLNPDTNYQIDLVAFNMAGFRSRSSPIFVKTAALTDSLTFPPSGSALDHPDALLRALLPRASKPGQLMVHEAFRSRSRSSTVDGSTGSPFEPVEPLRTPPNLITDINELKFLLESGLDEVKSLIRSYKEAEQEFKEEESGLVLARSEARQRRRIEDSNRANLRQEIRYLEEQRMKTENRLSGDRRKLEVRLKKMEQKQAQITLWEDSISEMQRKKEERSLEQPLKLEQLTNEIQEFHKEVFSLQAETHGLDTELKEDLNQRRQLDTQKEELAAMFTTIDRETDVQTGLLKPEGQEELDKLLKARPEWSEELMEEVIGIDKRSESQWRELQQREFQKVESLKREMEELGNGHPLVVNASANGSNSNSNSISNNSGSFYGVSSPSATYAGSPQWQPIQLQLRLSEESPSDLNLLPQNLIDGEELNATNNSSVNNVNVGSPGSIDMLSNGMYSDVSGVEYPLTSLSALASNASNLGVAAAVSSTGTAGVPSVGTANGPSLGSPQSLRGSPLQPSDSVLSAPFLEINGQNASTYGTHSVFDGFTAAVGSNNSNISLGNSPPQSNKERTVAQLSKLLDTFTRNSVGAGDVSSAGNSVDYGRNSLELISRARSTSIGSSIWSNSKAASAFAANGSINSNWGSSLGVMASSEKPDIVQSPKEHVHSRLKNWGTASTESTGSTGSTVDESGSLSEQDQHQSSPSFFKGRLFKFGASPTKSASKTSGKSSFAITEPSDESGGPSDLHSSGHIVSSLGSRSSRFFKLGTRKASVHSQNSTSGSSASGEPGSSKEAEGVTGIGASNSSGGMFSRKLTFGFMRDKEREVKTDKIDEADEEDEDERLAEEDGDPGDNEKEQGTDEKLETDTESEREKEKREKRENKERDRGKRERKDKRKEKDKKDKKKERKDRADS